MAVGLRWALGVAAATAGGLMLLVPHWLQLPAYAALRPDAVGWGWCLVLAGLALLGVPVLDPAPLVRGLVHLAAGLGLLAVAWAATVHAAAWGVAAPWALLGLVVLASAALAVRPRPAARRGSRRMARTAFPLLGLAGLAYAAGVALPSGDRFGAAVFGVLGGLVVLLPWLGPALARLDPRALRGRVAYALVVFSVLPLLAVASVLGAQGPETPEAQTAREAALPVVLGAVGVSVVGAVVVAGLLAAAAAAAANPIRPLPDSRTGEVARLAAALAAVERDLERARREAALLLEVSAEGLCGLDRDGRATFLNPAGAALLGYAPGDVVGQPLHALVHHTRADGSTYPEDACPLRAVLAGGPPVRVAGEVFWHQSGAAIPVAYVGAPVLLDGVAVGAVLAFREVG